MPQFIVIKGSVKRGQKFHGVGETLELTVEEKRRMDPHDDCIVSKEKAEALKQISDAKARIAQLSQSEKDSLLAKHLPKPPPAGGKEK